MSYVGASTRQGIYAEYQLVSELDCAYKPRPLDFVEAASFGLTFGMAYQSLHDRLEIKPNENVGIMIINSGGGVGSAAMHLARNVLNLPVVVATASRQETMGYCKEMGVTHVINHRKHLVEETEDLKLGSPIKHVYVFASTEQNVDSIAKVCALFDKACTIVQADVSLYGTELMSRLMAFAWGWLGSAVRCRSDWYSYKMACRYD